MDRHELCGRLFAIALASLLVISAPLAPARAGGDTIVAQAEGTRPGELEPRYRPAPPQEKSAYNSDYIFALTRGVADSTMVPAAKVTLMFFTIPVDLVLLPVATIGGLFG